MNGDGENGHQVARLSISSNLNIGILIHTNVLAPYTGLMRHLNMAATRIGIDSRVRERERESAPVTSTEMDIN